MHTCNILHNVFSVELLLIIWATLYIITHMYFNHYTKYDMLCLIIFSVVTTLFCSTLIINFLTISVRIQARRCDKFLLSSLLFLVFHILTNTKFKHVTPTYYHSWYLVFEFTFMITCFHMVIDISVRVRM